MRLQSLSMFAHVNKASPFSAHLQQDSQSLTPKKFITLRLGKCHRQSGTDIFQSDWQPLNHEMLMLACMALALRGMRPNLLLLLCHCYMMYACIHTKNAMCEIDNSFYFFLHLVGPHVHVHVHVRPLAVYKVLKTVTPLE